MIHILLNLLLASEVHAQTYFAGKSPDQIVELKKKATLQMQIFNDKGRAINTFTGFFVGKEGRFITVNHSFLDDFKFEKGVTKISIKDNSGKEYSDIIIEGCSNKNNIDICTGLLKNTKPKSYFEFISSERREAELFTSIGHCNNDQLAFFTVKKGEVKKITSDYQSTYNAVGDPVNLNTKLFEVSLPKCVGDSGGPLFDQYSGALMGMYTFAYKNHYFAIDSSELKKLFDENASKSLYAIPAERVQSSEPCSGMKKGTREYENCKALE